jgi:ribose 1,5-bisphosphokinase
VAAGASSSLSAHPGTADRARAVGPGWVVLVVGPSGAGKDSVLNEARVRLAGDARFVFPRRVVTRVADGSEDHASLSRDAFEDLAARGGFALHWHAHGHRYGIPAEADVAVRAGRTAVFNASRQIVPVARGRYAGLAVVMVDAPVEIRAARLATRNREHAEQVLARLGRVVTGFSAEEADLVIDNSGPLTDSADRLVRWLQMLAARGAAT